MVRKRLVGALAMALAVPIAVGVLPASTGFAVPAQPPVGGQSDVTVGTKAPRTVDGKALKAPDHYTPRTAARRAKAAAGVTPPVGTVRQWISNDDLNGYYRKDYTLRGAGDHIEVWVANDLSFPEGDCRNAVAGSTTVTEAQVNGLINEFDTNMYPKETETFSTPPDRDGSNAVVAPDANGNGGDYSGDGAKTVTLVDNVRDDNYYDFPARTTYIAGFFSSYLNEILDRNVMTIDAFDWAHRTTANPVDGQTSDPCTSRPARPYLYEGTFAHEWQHLLQYYTDPNEVTWVNEGLSDFAMALTGYSNSTATIFEPGQESHLTCFQGYGIVQTTYNPNPRDCGGPQNSLNLWNEGGDNGNAVLADYGNAYSFILFLYDRYGEEFISKLHRDGERQGLASLDAELEAIGVKDQDQVLHDFQTSTLLDKFLTDSKKSVIHGGLTKAAVTTKSLQASVNLDNPQSYADPGAAPNGADYVLLKDKAGKALPGSKLRRFEFQGAKTLPTLPLAWSVVTDDPDRSGNPVLFSGNANSTDAAMVAKVTVPAANPTLSFLAKYGAEAGYDYGYVSVSTDGGATYSAPIAGNHTVADGPLGAGLNGTTTGFEAESYDLSAYAGKSVLVSIRYVSDGGVNEGGLLVDDVKIGNTTISDGSSLAAFKSPTEIKPTKVKAWDVRLVGLNPKNHEVYVVEYHEFGLDRTLANSNSIKKLQSYPQVVAIVAYDEPTEQVQQYAPYTLTVNGAVQAGGSAN